MGSTPGALRPADGRRRLRPAPEPDVRRDRGLPAGGRRHRRGAQGDVRLHRQGRPPHGAAARGHGVGGAGLRRAPARHARGRSGTPPPASATSARRRGRYRQHHQLGVEAIGIGRPRPRRRGHRAAWPTSTPPRPRTRSNSDQLAWARRPTGPPTSKRCDLAPPASRTIATRPTERRSPTTRLRVLDSKQASHRRAGCRRRPADPRRPRCRGHRPISSGCSPGSDAAGHRHSHRSPAGARPGLLHPHDFRVRQAVALESAQNAHRGRRSLRRPGRALGGRADTRASASAPGSNASLFACDAEGAFGAPDRARRRLRRRCRPEATQARDLTVAAASCRDLAPIAASTAGR